VSFLVALITCGIIVYGIVCVVTSMPWLKKKYIEWYAQPLQKYTLTIDDMPDDAADEILDVLRDFSQYAVIFVTGSRIKKNERILRRIIDEGHQLGNHSYAHYFYNPLSTHILVSGIVMTDEVLATMHYATKHVRTPHGYTTRGLLEWCRNEGKVFWYWDVILMDFLPLPFYVLRWQADRYIRRGGILCMHGRVRSVRILRYICERISHAH
jgi:peptidoglycan/xylan/chitin deacetylase (PgdA/CDA1 family)